MELDKLPFADDFFQAVISFHVIEHLSDPDNYLTEIRRVLNPGGVFLIVTPDWRKQYKTFWRDHTHKHPYDKESLARVLRAYGFSLYALKSFGTFRGLGRFRLYKIFPGAMFSGIDMIAVVKK